MIDDYLNSKGLGFKFKNGEYCLNECPLNGCGPGHFFINQVKEVFCCHKCGERGHILSLKKRLGDLPLISHASDFSKSKPSVKTIDLSIIEKYHQSLLENAAALSYLTEERGFSLEMAKKFKLGFHNGSISIPYFKDGLCLGIKFRSLAGKRYYREEGCPSILFNIDNARKYEGAVIVVEGELDGIAYDQMGFPNVVSVPNGAEAFSDNWVDDVEQFDDVYISFDMDEPGRKGALKVAEKLGRYRCYDVHLPLKDANDCLKAGFTYEEMSQILAQAKRFESPIIKTSETFFDEIRGLHSGKESKGLMTGWPELDVLINGFRPTELTIVTGETGSGKTTWVANIGYRLSKKKHPGLIASFEMKPLKIIRKMIQMERGRPFNELSKDELESALQYLSTLPIHFIDVYGEIGLSELKDAIYYARRRYEIEFVVLDHLHFFLRYSGDHERQAIDQALRDIKSWAMNLGIHIFLVVHPTKLTYDNKVVSLNDLKGSSGLKQFPDCVVSIWRPRGEDDLKKPQGEVLLYILKCRDDLGSEGKVILKFDKRSQSYEDPEPGVAIPAEGKRIPESSSPRFRFPSGRGASGYI